MNRVFITAYSVISAMGIGNEKNINCLIENKRKIYIPKEKDLFKKPYFPIQENLENNEDITLSSKLALKLLSLIENHWIDLAPIPLFLATSTGGIKETEEVYISLKKNNKKYNLSGKYYFYDIYHSINKKYKNKIEDPYTFSTACSASGHAIFQAYRFMKNNVIEKALVIGVDALSITTMFGFDSLKLVSEKGTNPLSRDRDGLSLGEGGAVILLESNPETSPIAEIVAASSNSDGYHITSPNPDGSMQIECIEKCLNMANITSKEIDYINAHGTGTLTNDEIEMKAIKSCFPEPVPVTSLKAFIGHTVGSSAIIEIVLCLEMLKKKLIVQPENFTNPIDEEYIPKKTISKTINYFLKNSFGFGGNNVSIIVKT